MDDAQDENPRDQIEIYDSKLIEIHTILEHASYTIGAGAFWGQFFLIWFLGSGLVTFPISCFITWADRPKPSNEGDFKKKKDMLIKKLDHLLKKGREAYNERVVAEADYTSKELKFKDRVKYFIGFTESSKNQHQFETNCILVENEYRKLVQTSEYSLRVEPIQYTCLFFTGGLFSFFFLIFFIHMFMAGTL